MKPYSIFNDVLGPVMHGPSSSHTAASHRLGLMTRALLGAEPTDVLVTFDRQSSFGLVFRAQGSDLALAAGLMGWAITDERFFQALESGKGGGMNLAVELGEIPEDSHPNALVIRAASGNGMAVRIRARSIGGGGIEIAAIDDWPLLLTGRSYDLIVVTRPGVEAQVREILATVDAPQPMRYQKTGLVAWHWAWTGEVERDRLVTLAALPGVERIYYSPPVFFVPRGRPICYSAREMINLAQARGWSLGRLALTYEADLLGLAEEEVLAEMDARLEVMIGAVRQGLAGPDDLRPMRLLEPTAHLVFQAEAAGRVPLGGPMTRAAARAMAVMHVNAGMGLVVAAPTGGSCGALPGVAVTLLDDLGFDRRQVAMGLLAAAAIGLVVLMRGDTFAAEVAGCQVEIGAAGAMAAAAVVDVYGGSAGQAVDAATIALHHSMGWPCDLVQGAVEIPCHTRNALVASAAFTCADLILGGYVNPIGLDDTVDASLAVGQALPPELRCTSLGGLAVTPSALNLKRL